MRPRVALDYVCNNDYRRKRYSVWIGLVLAVVLGGAAMFLLP